jgi:ribosome-associated translation inhibitor RaiA
MIMPQTTKECVKEECRDNRNQLLYVRFENDSIKEDLKIQIDRLQKARTQLQNTQENLKMKQLNNEKLKSEIIQLSKIALSLENDVETVTNQTVHEIETTLHLEQRNTDLQNNIEDMYVAITTTKEALKNEVQFQKSKVSDDKATVRCRQEVVDLPVVSGLDITDGLSDDDE